MEESRPAPRDGRSWVMKQWGKIPLRRWLGLHELDLEIQRARWMRRLNRQSRVLTAILHERKYQDSKWGPLEKQNGRNLYDWVRTLNEEVDEVHEALYNWRDCDLFLELVQVAVVVACLEQLAPEGIDELMRVHREGK